MNHDPRGGGDDSAETADFARLRDLLARDAGPGSRDLAEARLKLKRALAREKALLARRPGLRVLPGPRRLASEPWLRRLTQAAGFALLLALLSPFVPRLVPDSAGVRGADLVLLLADGAREVSQQMRPWLPTLPDLPDLRLPDPMEMAPSQGLFDWVPALHFETR